MKLMSVLTACLYVCALWTGASAASSQCTPAPLRVVSHASAGGMNFAYMIAGPFGAEYRAPGSNAYEPVEIRWRIRKTEADIEDTYPNDNQVTATCINGEMYGTFCLGIAAGGVYVAAGTQHKDAQLCSINALQELLNNLLQMLLTP